MVTSWLADLFTASITVCEEFEVTGLYVLLRHWLVSSLHLLHGLLVDESGDLVCLILLHHRRRVVVSVVELVVRIHLCQCLAGSLVLALRCLVALMVPLRVITLRMRSFLRTLAETVLPTIL